MADGPEARQPYHAAEGLELAEAERLLKGYQLSLGGKAVGLGAPALQRALTELGRGVGPPWGQDQKYAALAAWLALRQA